MHALTPRIGRGSTATPTRPQSMGCTFDRSDSMTHLSVDGLCIRNRCCQSSVGSLPASIGTLSQLQQLCDFFYAIRRFVHFTVLGWRCFAMATARYFSFLLWSSLDLNFGQWYAFIRSLLFSQWLIREPAQWHHPTSARQPHPTATAVRS